jgi:hypothetical protein
MKWLLVHFICMALVTSSAKAAVLFVDLNDAPLEYDACAAGAGPDEVHVIGAVTNGGQPINGKHIEQKVAQLEAAGITVDSIVVSGHDGSGHFFGENGSEFYAADLRRILKNHPQTASTLTSAALWGCYPTTVYGCDSFWLKPNKNIKVAMGFTIQSPDKTRPANHALMKEFCGRRKEAVEAVSKDQLCAFYKSLRHLETTHVNLCNRTAMASREYGPENCYDYEDLQNRCAEFDPDEAQLVSFAKYFSANDPGFDNPPKDSAKSELRKYYNQIHLWRHCTETLKTERGYDLPSPPQVIRLVKFDVLKANLNRLNRNELADYDSRLEELGLGYLKLGDLTKVSRGEINRRIDAALVNLGKMAKRKQRVGDTDSTVVWRMAQFLKATLVDLQFRTKDTRGRYYSCSHFSLVDPSAKRPSRCIMSYDQAAAL